MKILELIIAIYFLYLALKIIVDNFKTSKSSSCSNCSTCASKKCPMKDGSLNKDNGILLIKKGK